MMEDFFVVFFDSNRTIEWKKNSIHIENIKNVFPGRLKYFLLDVTNNNTLILPLKKRFEGLKNKHKYQIPRVHFSDNEKDIPGDDLGDMSESEYSESNSDRLSGSFDKVDSNNNKLTKKEKEKLRKEEKEKKRKDKEREKKKKQEINQMHLSRHSEILQDKPTLSRTYSEKKLKKPTGLSRTDSNKSIGKEPAPLVTQSQGIEPLRRQTLGNTTVIPPLLKKEASGSKAFPGIPLNMRKMSDNPRMSDPLSSRVESSVLNYKRKAEFTNLPLKVIKEFKAQDEKELNLEEGETVMFIENDENGYALGVSGNNYGWFPLSHIEIETTPTTQHQKQIVEELKLLKNGEFPEKKFEKTVSFTSVEQAKQEIVNDLEKRKYLTKFFKEKSKKNLNQLKKTSRMSMKVPLFGLSLEAIIETYGREYDIPPPISTCIDYLEENEGDKIVGLFRVPGNSILIESVKTNWTVSRMDKLDQHKDPAHNAASILKMYFSCLPEPIFPSFTWDLFQTLYDEKKLDVENVKKVIEMIPDLNRKIIYYLFCYLRKVADNKQINNMDEKNLGMVFGATLMSPIGKDPMALLNKMPHFVIEFILNNFQSLFDEADKKFTKMPSEKK